MKARVKETGELVEVHTCDDADFQDRQGRYYWEHQLYFGTLDNYDNEEPNYWTSLEHQYAGMAMQQLVHLVNVGYEYVYEETAIIAMNFAHALVEKLKEKEEK